MSNYYKFSIVLCIFFLSSLKVKGVDDQYFRSLYLDKERLFRLSWKFDNETITFEVQVKSKGWVGLGFSPNGAMTGSDIVVAWVDENGKAHISDRFATQNEFPSKDKHQDYILLKGKKHEDGLSFIFQRKINTCDKQDNEITTGATRIIYAFDDAVPKSEDVFNKHAFNRRGSKTVYSFDIPNGERPLPGDVVSVDFRAKNVSVPDGFHTLYWCEVVEIPDLGAAHHLIRHEPIVQRGNEHIVHHITLSHCNENLKQFVGKGEACFDRMERNESKPFLECDNNMVYIWAVGGQAFDYPEDVGMLLFGPKKSRIFLLELHYDNSNFQKNIVDNSGVKLYFTPTLRKHSSAKVSFAAAIGPTFQIIPPGQDSFTTYAYCSAECTNEAPSDGWTVFSVLVHEHKAGKVRDEFLVIKTLHIINETSGVKGRLRHIRNGVMLEDIVNDQYYDFNFQNTRLISKEVKIMPGDQLVTECTYNTTGRKNITFGGYSTREEMCFVIIDAYPLLGGFACYSAPSPLETWKMFGANLSKDENTTVPMPDGSNMTLVDFALTQIHFNSTEQIEAYQNTVRNSKHLIWCGMFDNADINGSNETGNSNLDVFDTKFQFGYPNVTKSVQYSKKEICY